jgi:hypothetical protein
MPQKEESVTVVAYHGQSHVVYVGRESGSYTATDDATVPLETRTTTTAASTIPMPCAPVPRTGPALVGQKAHREQRRVVSLHAVLYVPYRSNECHIDLTSAPGKVH